MRKFNVEINTESDYKNLGEYDIDMPNNHWFCFQIPEGMKGSYFPKEEKKLPVLISMDQSEIDAINAAKL